ncbi:hypothetical protein GCM10010442_66900 [Kitasatospora kifunensis]
MAAASMLGMVSLGVLSPVGAVQAAQPGSPVYAPVSTSSVFNSVFKAPAAAAQAVNISGFAFSPASLTVPVGTTVTWTNHDPVTHTVTSTGSGPLKGTVNAGATYSYTFTTAGTYAYVCTIHPGMAGTVTVK